jgi:hypothetical protein
MDGGKLMEVGQSFLESFMESIISLEHGTCLCLTLNLGNMLVYESYQSHASLYVFVLLKKFSYCHHIILLVLIE